MRVEPVQATSADGLTLRGELVRGDETWVVLVHDVGEDIDVWKPLRSGLNRRGWTALALDLRGHGGSDGEWTGDRGELDVDLAVTLARRLGARHVALVTAGRASVPALRAVERAVPEERFELPDSMVLLSPGPLDGADPMTLRGAGLPKLVLLGAQDPDGADALSVARASIGWTVTVTFASEAHGTALLADWSSHVLDKVKTFVTEQSALRGLGRARAERRRLEPRTSS
jgi:pimeloyl-ACP methyl ester carboxylesterase